MNTTMIGRTMELAGSFLENKWDFTLHPRGENINKYNYFVDKNRFNHKSKYGFIGIEGVLKKTIKAPENENKIVIVVDGMNEHGFTISALTFSESI